MPPLQPGQVLRHRFRLLSLLGRGSFSTVYLADDAQWKGNLVAIKEIRTDHLSEREYAQLNVHFLQEAALLMTLQHRGLPRVIDFFGEGQSYYLVLEWIAGHTLEAHVLEHAPVSEKDVRAWALQLLDVLAYLHGQKPYPIILGDLKPANVVVQYDGRLRVIDFGLARHVQRDRRADIALVSPGFSPPEQFRGDPLEERSDLYSLGATLYWCLDPHPLERYQFQIPPLRTRRPEVSQALDDLLLKCLAFTPAHRPQSAGHLHTAFSLPAAQAPSLPSPAQILSDLYRGKKRQL